MKLRIPRWALPAALAIAVVAAGIATGAIPSGDGTIRACYKQSGGAVRIVDEAAKCANGEVAITWSQRGPVGPVGPAGPTGEAGPRGPAGQGILRANVVRALPPTCGVPDPTGVIFPCATATRVRGDATDAAQGNGGIVVSFAEDVSECSSVATIGHPARTLDDPDFADGAVIAPEGNLVTHPGEPSAQDVTVKLYEDGELRQPETDVAGERGTSFQLQVAC